jgi:hypothetical protein
MNMLVIVLLVIIVTTAEFVAYAVATILKDMDKTRPDQHPICTTIGNGFDTEAFK